MWSQLEAQQHIKLLELRAIGLALKTFCKHMFGCHILVRDNQVAVRYVNAKGGTHSDSEQGSNSDMDLVQTKEKSDMARALATVLLPTPLITIAYSKQY